MEAVIQLMTSFWLKSVEGSLFVLGGYSNRWLQLKGHKSTMEDDQKSYGYRNHQYMPTHDESIASCCKNRSKNKHYFGIFLPLRCKQRERKLRNTSCKRVDSHDQTLKSISIKSQKNTCFLGPSTSERSVLQGAARSG